MFEDADGRSRISDVIFGGTALVLLFLFSFATAAEPPLGRAFLRVAAQS
jgi:hypothetical protein